MAPRQSTVHEVPFGATGDRPRTVDPLLNAPASSGRSLWRTALRWALWLGVLGLVVFVMLIPYPYQTGGWFRSLPVKRAEVRSEVEGLVEAVLVREGEMVKAGQTIARIAVRTHVKNLTTLQSLLAHDPSTP